MGKTYTEEEHRQRYDAGYVAGYQDAMKDCRAGAQPLQPIISLVLPVSVDASTEAMMQAALDRQQADLVERLESSTPMLVNLQESIGAANGLFNFIKGVTLAANTAAQNPIKRGEIIRAILAQRIDERDTSALLTSAIKQVLNDAAMFSDEQHKQAQEAFLPIYNDFDQAMLCVLTGQDNGDALLALVAQNPGFAPYLDVEKVIGESGRRPGATPVNRYLLDEMRRLKALHDLKTRGEVYEKMMKNLLARQDVQHWQRESAGLVGLEREKQIRARGVEIQAYELLAPHINDRAAGAEKLKEIEANERKRNRRWGG